MSAKLNKSSVPVGRSGDSFGSKRLRGDPALRAQSIEWKSVPHRPSGEPLRRLFAPDPASGSQMGIESLEAAEQDSAERRSEAYQKGYRDAEAALAAAANAQIQARVEDLAKAVDNLASYRRRIRNEAEADLVRLSLAIARRVIQRELSVDPNALLGVVKAALERLDAGELKRVRLSQANAEAVRRLIDARGADIEVIADPALGPGDAIFEALTGQLDAGIDSQLAEIERGFTDLIPQ